MMEYDPVMHEIGSKAATLNFTSFSPHPLLRDVVSCYHVIVRENLFPSNYHWHILPDQCPHLIFYLFEVNGSITPQLTLVGPRSEHKIISRNQRRFTFISTFKPGGLKPFIHLPLHSLADQSIEASAIFPDLHSGIIEQLAASATLDDHAIFIQTLEKFLLKTLISNPIPHPLLAAYQSLLEKWKSREAPRLLGYSDRQLRNIFRDHVGLSPKKVEQIHRFTNTLRQSANDRNWARIAHNSGYYDQSHMISDFQKLVGSPPEKLLGSK